MSYAPKSSPGPRLLPACAGVVLVLLTHPVWAQDVREIATATRLRKEPDGVALVALPVGTSVEAKRARGAWHEVVVEGWIFSQSLEPTRRDGFDLVVTSGAGENIRESPNGEVLGRALPGTLLHKQEVRGGWTRVRRAGWVPREAIAIESGAIPPTTDAESPAVQAPAAPQTPVQNPAAPPTVKTAADDRVELAREAPVFAAPAAGPYGTLQAGAAARVLGRSGDWARVQLEGWVRESDLKAGSDAALKGITAAEVRADPPRYLGRTVDWRLELISVQTADALRSEMPLGQSYLLTRGPLPEPGFVYVTVSEAQAAQFRALQALEELTLRVIIKAPRTKFLATPVVELVSIAPSS